MDDALGVASPAAQALRAGRRHGLPHGNASGSSTWDCRGERGTQFPDSRCADATSLLSQSQRRICFLETVCGYGANERHSGWKKSTPSIRIWSLPCSHTLEFSLMVSPLHSEDQGQRASAPDSPLTPCDLKQKYRRRGWTGGGHGAPGPQTGIFSLHGPCPVALCLPGSPETGLGQCPAVPGGDRCPGTSLCPQQV